MAVVTLVKKKKECGERCQQHWQEHRGSRDSHFGSGGQGAPERHRPQIAQEVPHHDPVITLVITN